MGTNKRGGSITRESIGAVRCDQDVGLHVLGETFLI